MPALKLISVSIKFTYLECSPLAQDEVESKAIMADSVVGFFS